MMRVALVAALLSGCGFSLDPYLYTPGRTDKYELAPEGDDVETTVDPSRIEPHTIRVNDEIELGAVMVRAKERPAKADVIFFHGKGGTLDNAFHRIKRLSNMGFDVLGYDYRGWGISTNVAPSEAGLDEDGRAVTAWFSDRVGGRGRLVYYGVSFGTFPAVQRAEAEPPRALILESGPASVEAIKRDSTGTDVPVLFFANDGWDSAGRLRGMYVPVLILHGTDDDVVSYDFGVQLHAAANEPKKFVTVEGADHSDLIQRMGPAEYSGTVTSWISTHP